MSIHLNEFEINDIVCQKNFRPGAVNSTSIFLFQKCLSFKQSVGMIGGKPNHAHWFIGYVGKNCVYFLYTSWLDLLIILLYIYYEYLDLNEKATIRNRHKEPF